jgi:hypothetical protein
MARPGSLTAPTGGTAWIRDAWLGLLTFDPTGNATTWRQLVTWVSGG